MFEYLLDKKGALFDLDGTIIDTENLWQQAIYSAFEKYYHVEWVFLDDRFKFGTSMEEKVRQIIELEKLEKYVKDTPQIVATNIYNEFLSMVDQIEEFELKDGFINFLAYLKVDNGFKIGLTTNTVKEVASQVLAKLNLIQVFDVIVYGDDVKNPKPDPGIYHKAVKDIGLKPSELIVFEDSLPGVQAAVKAGLDTVVVWDRKHRLEDYPENITDAIDDFTAYQNTIGKTYKEIIEPLHIDEEGNIMEDKNIPDNS